MQISRFDAQPTQFVAEAIVVGVHTQGVLTKSAAEVDQAAGGVITNLFENHEITGRANEVLVLHAVAGVSARKVVVVGLGPAGATTRQIAFRAAASASQVLSRKKHTETAWFLGDGWSDDLIENGVAGAIFGCYGQDLYRSEKKRHPYGQLLWNGGTVEVVEQGKVVGEALILARRLVNEPPNVVYPESFAETAVQVAAEYGLEIEVWNEKKLADERCGSLLAVNQGSVRQPRVVIWRWNGGKEGVPPLAIVGKGVTFDSGGLSLKPSDSMRTMKYDMAGAAHTLAAMTAIARLRLPVNVIGLAGLVENMPSGSAVKLGDVLTARNGKTIEVLNTDAEGRLVLADVLNVAVTMGADRIVDMATLTGACVVALGNDVGGLLTNNDGWGALVLKAAERSGELVWQLPMFPEYNDDVKSEVADIRNVGAGRWAGAIAGAKFLEHFVDNVPWVHLDIAGPAFLESGKSWCDGGSTGYFIRTLIELVREQARVGKGE